MSKVFEFQSNPTNRNFEKVLDECQAIIKHLTDGRPAQFRDDYFQIGRIAVWKAAKSFRGQSAFSTYAFSCVRNEMYQFSRSMKPLEGIQVEDRRCTNDVPVGMFDDLDPKERKTLSKIISGRGSVSLQARKLRRKIESQLACR